MFGLRHKYNIALLLVNILLIILVVLILELIFGDWINTDNLNKLNLIRSRTIKYNVDGLYPSSAKVVFYSRDKYGLRGSYGSPENITILTVGGSTTDQRYIADGQTWQDILQNRFKFFGKNIFIGNAGVDGQSTIGHIKNFEWWFNKVPNFKPKIIIYYVGLNDFYANNSYDTLTKSNSFSNYLKERSALYHVLRIFYVNYLALFEYKIGHLGSDFANIGWTSAPLQSSYDNLMERRLCEYENRLNMLINKTREFGSIPIFMTQPSRNYKICNGKILGKNFKALYEGVPINGVDYYYMIKKLNNATINVCDLNGSVCLDLATEVNWEDGDFYDFYHNTPKGAKKIGEFIFKKLSQSNLIKKCLY